MIRSAYRNNDEAYCVDKCLASLTYATEAIKTKLETKTRISCGQVGPPARLGVGGGNLFLLVNMFSHAKVIVLAQCVFNSLIFYATTIGLLIREICPPI